MAYEYDIFVSYRRSAAAGGWVQKHFVPRLQMWLDELTPSPLRIACDFRMEEGVDWPMELRHQIHRSRLLVAVWNAPYFSSAWCMAEWQSFRRREEILELRTPQKPKGLVYPVRFADGEYFHDEAKATLCKRDFSDLNHPDDCFSLSESYLRFSSVIQEMAADIVEDLKVVPDWQDTFPIVEEIPLPPPVMRRVAL